MKNKVWIVVPLLLISLASCEKDEYYTSILYSVVKNDKVQFVEKINTKFTSNESQKYSLIQLYSYDSKDAKYVIENVDGTEMSMDSIQNGMEFELLHRYKGTLYVYPEMYNVDSMKFTGNIIENFNPDFFDPWSQS